MAKVRGFVYFEDKSLMEVREALWNFDVPGLRYKLFEGVSWPRDKSNAPGIFIDGEVDSKSKNYSREVIFMLRQKVGLEKKIINCDVSSSVGKEDCISHLQGGGFKGQVYRDKNSAPISRHRRD